MKQSKFLIIYEISKYLFLPFYIYLYFYLSTFISTSLPLFLPLYLYFYLYLYLSTSLPLFISLYLSTSIYRFFLDTLVFLTRYDKIPENILESLLILVFGDDGALNNSSFSGLTENFE